MKKVKTEYTVYPSGKIYTFVNGEVNKDIPSLYQITLSARWISNTGCVNPSVNIQREIYVEKKTLENAGLFPKTVEQTKPEETETVESLMYKLLEFLGFYPEP